MLEHWYAIVAHHQIFILVSNPARLVRVVQVLLEDYESLLEVLPVGHPVLVAKQVQIEVEIERAEPYVVWLARLSMLTKETQQLRILIDRLLLAFFFALEKSRQRLVQIKLFFFHAQEDLVVVDVVKTFLDNAWRRLLNIRVLWLLFFVV